ncbi:ABC transporter permease [Streptomyces scopuliridis]|uniref:Transporter n=2 Tax=Streptomyces scopuliridis TaxID=452529 RepID=A0A2T7T5H5_9ACTN|nr:ABC transporter permease [Streptomyces scopuliridis]PVE10383.1 transporter [Streptomyces scopuliridis RB72]WSB33262.1 ABC transporter permease [Streptomyces scopuliridis]WSB97518.1 ABC transporter permease [Streptomyces scopuliridis]WSC08779.1 ABC transporter permease [Streptomyces scopuliridis]
MFSLAIRSIATRPGRFLATLLSAFLGAAIIMAFHSMHDTAGAGGIDSASAETLRLVASVVGGYGALLVFFAVASTLTVNVRQRGTEIALLRGTGATPAQITRMIVGESAAVALAGAVLAIGPAMLGGRALLSVFQDTGQVADGVAYAFGPIALGSGLGITLLAATGAAFLAVRRATKALAGAAEPRGRGRNAAGAAALVAGTAGVCATFAMDSTAPSLMAAPACGAILLSVGLALFAPALLRALLGALERPLSALAGASGYLTVHTMRHRATRLSGVLMPLTLFTGIATATLTMQALENDAIAASGLTRSVEDKNLETVNLVVVGIIVVFSCVTLINSLYAATSYRRREFGQQRLVGATPGQVLGMVGVEGLALTVTGVFFGTVAGLAGSLAFSLVRTDEVLPGQGPGIWLGVTAVAAAATLVTSVGTARRALRTPAVEAMATAA